MGKFFFVHLKMSTLAKWQSFARSNGLKGWSRLKKYELVDFLVQNLWSGGGGLDEPKMNKAAKLRNRKYQKNPLVKKNPAIKVPILNPGKRSVFQKAIPKKIEENVENVVDWAKWLESVKDAEIRKKINSRGGKIEKTNRRIVGRKTCCGKRQIRFWKIRKTIHHSRG